VYISRTYSEMVPYLKGIHLTLDGERVVLSLVGNLKTKRNGTIMMGVSWQMPSMKKFSL
jgi:hypothetical protein